MAFDPDATPNPRLRRLVAAARATPGSRTWEAGAATIAALARAEIWRWAESATFSTGIHHRPAEMARLVLRDLTAMLAAGEFADSRMPKLPREG
jgi:hypothetical protein